MELTKAILTKNIDEIKLTQNEIEGIDKQIIEHTDMINDLETERGLKEIIIKEKLRELGVKNI